MKILLEKKSPAGEIEVADLKKYWIAAIGTTLLLAEVATTILAGGRSTSLKLPSTCSWHQDEVAKAS